jgi:hypothetical protein
MNDERRSPLFLITGVVIGFILGLVYAWVFTPVESFETHPATLQDSYKDTYREMIAVAYVASGDLGRAKARLDLLGDEDPARALTVRAQLTLGEDGSEEIAQALGILAANLAGDLAAQTPAETELPGETGSAPPPTDGVSTPARTLKPTATRPTTGAPGTEQPGTPAETESVNETAPLPPTQIPTATQGAPFTLENVALDCGKEYPTPLIQVIVLNASNFPVPGVEIVVTWDGGRNTFFTGLKPEFGLGYADFEMTPGVVYDLQLVGGDRPYTGLTAQDCEGSEGTRYWGSWRLNYKQP